jgi:outer membrane protein TolC
LHLRALLEAAYREAEGASAQLQALRSDVVPALLEARQMTEESYRSGRVDLIRLLETQRALLESQVAEVAALAAWGRALAELERASGRRLDAGVADAR